MKQSFSIWLKASLALFAVSVAGASIAAFSFASSPSALVADLSGSYETVQPSAPCDELKKIMDSGQYTADQKAQWTNCQQGMSQPSNSCDALKKAIDSGFATADQKDSWIKCQQEMQVQPTFTEPTVAPSSTCDELKKLMDSGAYTADQKQQYLKCQAMGTETAAQAADQAKTDCENLRNMLEKASENPNTQDYTDLKAKYTQTCYAMEQKTTAQEAMPTTTQTSTQYVAESQQCKDLRAKIAAVGSNTAQANPQDVIDLKATFEKLCIKGNTPPPAGYEDVVLTNPDTYSNPFPDTNLADRQGKAAAELYRRGVIGGFPDGQFKGDNPVNRAEAAKFLLLACGKDSQANYTGKFRDLMKGQWYVPYVEAAAAQGVINGYSDGTFRPANTVNRGEFAKMITKACGLPENLDYSLFTDVKAGDWFAPFAGAVQKYQLFPDSAVDNLFKPATLMSRSDVAISIYQYLTNR